MADQAMSVVWIDANGRTRQTIIKTLVGAGSLLTAMRAGSLAGVNTWWQSMLQPAVGASTPGTYQTTADTARLLFQTGSGSIIRLTLPAPKVALFLADKITVDPANATVVSIVNAAVGHLSDGAGSAVVSFVGGVYDRSRGTDLLTP